MFTKNKNPETTTPEPVKAPTQQDAIRGAAMKPAARAASIICADMKINGSVTSEGALQIDGESGAHVKGDIVHSSLQIQSNAVFEGQVKHADDPLKETGPKGASASVSNESSTPMSSASPTSFGISTTAS